MANSFHYKEKGVSKKLGVIGGLVASLGAYYVMNSVRYSHPEEMDLRFMNPNDSTPRQVYTESKPSNLENQTE